MKTKISMVIAAVILFSGIFIFNSCTKSTDEKQQSLQEKEHLLDSYRQKLKNEPSTSTEIVNIKGKAFYADVNGNKIKIPSRGEVITNAWACRPPDESGADFVFVSMEREYTCGAGYRFLVTYKVNSEFNLLSWATATPSTGRVRLRNGTTTIYTSPAAAITVTNTNTVVGVNSYGEDLNEFIVKFRTDVVPEATYNNATSIQPNATIYTDCSIYPTLAILYSNQLSTVGAQHTTMPCLRIDKVYWTARSGSTPPSLAGANIFPSSSCFPANYVYPNKQEIKFKKNATDINYTGVFNLYTRGLAFLSVADVSLINYYDVWYIDAANTPGLTPGNVQVRYRNNHMGGSTGTGGPCVTQPDNTWVYETWYIN